MINQNGYPLDSSRYYMLCLGCLASPGRNDLTVGNGIEGHGLLDKSIEELASMS